MARQHDKSPEREINGMESKIRSLATYIEKAREEERRNIARRIHDDLGQMLTGLKIDLNWIRRRINGYDSGIQERIDGMNRLLDSTIQSARNISAELRPSILDDLGITEAVEWQAEEFEKDTGIRTDFLCENSSINLPEKQTIAVFRCFQEILTNIARHANAKNVSVQISCNKSCFIFLVSDDGIGISTNKANHPLSLGLLGMRERIREVGGVVEIQGKPDKGTTINIKIPLERQFSA
jgi:signal transduction histidine kinase